MSGKNPDKRKKQSSLDSFFVKKRRYEPDTLNNSTVDQEVPVPCDDVTTSQPGAGGSHLDTSGGTSETSEAPRSEPTEVEQFDRVDASDLGTKTSGASRPKLPSKQYARRDGRRFNIGYYDKYSWLEYSLETNAVYCYPCRMFAANACNSGEVLGERKFIDVGYLRFRDINEKCDKHENSKRHKNAVDSWGRYKMLSEKQNSGPVSIGDQLVSVSDKERNENRMQLKVVFDCIRYLARQGHALRGHDENADSSNRGNFVELLEFAKKYLEPEVASKFERRYGHYASHDIQNECIDLLGRYIKDDIRDGVKRSNYFSLLVDETKDASKKEQMCIILRYFDEVGGKIKERAIGTYHMKSLTADSLTKGILEQIDSLGVDMKNCVAQCYDGASVMSGWATGVQARIRDVYPQAIYIHCHAHRLNLVLVNSMKIDHDVANFLDLIQSLYNFIANSNTRNELFKKAQLELNQKLLTLERSVPTRWFYYRNCIQKIIQRFDAIVSVLDVSAAESPEAFGYRHTLLSFKSILIMFMCDKVLGITNSLSLQLQNKTESIMFASSLIRATSKQLKDLSHERSYNDVFSRSVEFAKKHEVSIEGDQYNDRGRSQRRKELSKKLTGFSVETRVRQSEEVVSQGEELSFKEKFRDNIYLKTVQKVTSEFSDRFDLNADLYETLRVFDPSAVEFLNASLVGKFAESYPNFFDESDLEALEHQVETARRSQEDSVDRNLNDLFTDLNKLPVAFDQLLKALKIALALPVSTASNERFFSVLKRVKNYLRTTCGQERLSNLLLINVEPECANECCLDDLVNSFGRMKVRRYPV